MGGGGVAAPQDAISAIFANPAAMCFGPYCPNSSVDFAGTWFDPTVNGSFTNNAGAPPPAPPTGSGESQLNPSVIPAIGITTPINERWRFGIGMYGVSGLGADFKGTGVFPPVYTQLQVMKFSPNLAWLITPNFSVGLSLEVVWQNLDLGEGSAHDYTLGAQIGALYHVGMFNFGASYTTPESVTHKNVTSFGAGGPPFYDLKIESPQTFKFGVSFEPNTTWLIEANYRWYNWSDADGYGDFGWDDQSVFAIGAQWKPAEKWAFRLGYNYGETPLKNNTGYNPNDATNVQGVPVNNVGYEFLRVVGFPALAEQHFTLGGGYKLTENMFINLSLMYSPEETFTEASAGNAFVYEVKLKEWSSSFGLTWYF
jgi:long-chain fatty acid transport protein